MLGLHGGVVVSTVASQREQREFACSPGVLYGWVLSGFSGFLPLAKNMHVRWTDINDVKQDKQGKTRHTNPKTKSYILNRIIKSSGKNKGLAHLKEHTDDISECLELLLYDVWVMGSRCVWSEVIRSGVSGIVVLRRHPSIRHLLTATKVICSFASTFISAIHLFIFIYSLVVFHF